MQHAGGKQPPVLFYKLEAHKQHTTNRLKSPHNNGLFLMWHDHIEIYTGIEIYSGVTEKGRQENER